MHNGSTLVKKVEKVAYVKKPPYIRGHFYPAHPQPGLWMLPVNAFRLMSTEVYRKGNKITNEISTNGNRMTGLWDSGRPGKSGRTKM